MERLKRHGINCLQPKRIMISGKIRVFCFDKTGTLTKEGLDFVGFQPPVSLLFVCFSRARASESEREPFFLKKSTFRGRFGNLLRLLFA